MLAQLGERNQSADGTCPGGMSRNTSIAVVSSRSSGPLWGVTTGRRDRGNWPRGALGLACARQPACYGARYRTTPHLLGLLTLLRAHGHDSRRGEVPSQVVRYLLGRNGVAEEAEAQEEPRAAGASAFRRIESIGLENRVAGNAFGIDWLYRPLQLHGE